MGRLHCCGYVDPYGVLGSKNVYYDAEDRPALVKCTDSKGHTHWSVAGNVVGEEKAHEIMKQLGWSGLLPPIAPAAAAPAAGATQYIQKAADEDSTTLKTVESGKGGSVPPKPEPKPFDPAASPYSTPPPRDPNLDRQEGFDPTRRAPFKEKP